jgi:hypothetical protein
MRHVQIHAREMRIVRLAVAEDAEHVADDATTQMAGKSVSCAVTATTGK